MKFVILDDTARAVNDRPYEGQVLHFTAYYSDVYDDQGNYAFGRAYFSRNAS